MADSCVDLFTKTVECVLNNWAALQLAVQHGMGGPDSVAKSQWLVGALDQYIKENNGLEVDEIEDFLEDFLNSEFDTIAEDGSSKAIALQLCGLYRIYQRKDNKQLEDIIQRLPKLDMTSTKECNNFASGSSSSSQITKPSICESMDQMQIDPNESVADGSVDDGDWQTVNRGRTKHKK